MMNKTKLHPAYPPRYYAQRWRGWQSALLWVLMCAAFAAGFGYTLRVGAGGGWQVAGLVLSASLGLIAGVGFIKDGFTVRIFPYYNQRLPEAGTYLRGHALARNCLRLDHLAEARGLKSISTFGFSDALWGEPIVWHDPADALPTIAGLMETVATRPETVDDPDRVRIELGKIKEALELCRERGLKFGFLLELGNSTNARIWEIRQGHV